MIVRSPSEISKLLAYNRWANANMLEPVAAVSPEEWDRQLGGSFGSLHGTLTHLYAGEWIWLERASGRSPKALPSEADLPTLGALRAAWSSVEAKLEELARGLPAADLSRPVRYTNFVGETWTYTLADILFDLVNHSTYHRGQVATLLRQLGKIPLSTDYSRFLDSGGLTPPGRTPEEIARLYAYNRWANARVLRAVSGIPAEDYRRAVGGSFSTLGDTLAHIYGADWVWLERFGGRSPRALPAGQQAETPQALEQKWRPVEDDWAALVGKVAPERMADRLEFTAFSGDHISRPVGEALVHVVNHSTYHRGQVATLMRQLGRTPASTDYLMMLDEGA
jgi:uncharacterized damage-inducible protein DinB